jgi:adenylate cyclase
VSDATILVVDDIAKNVRLLEAVLAPLGHRVITAANGEEALAAVAGESPDLVLLDIQMPVMDGYETCRRLRSDEATVALPVVMITAGGDTQRVKGLESGADDFIAKPFDHAELRARVQSLLRIKRYHDRIQHQSAELAEWAQTLDARVREQVEEMERLGRLRRFLSPQVADAVVAASGDDLLHSHRRELAVLFCELRGFAEFTASAEPEDVMAVLDHYYAGVGELMHRFEATVGHLTGDAIMAYFNDPLPCEDPALKAVELALEMRAVMVELTARWRKRGFRLGHGVGIALGYTTLGMIGFEGRMDYGPVGTVVNLAARLCAEAAEGDALLDQRAMAAVEASIEGVAVDPLTLRGFAEAVPAFRLVGRRDEQTAPATGEIAVGGVFGGYRIDKVLGRGGMGVVYRAWELGLDRPVALKVVAPHLLEDEGTRMQFVREARVAASLEHPNVVPIYAAGEHEGTTFLAMRLVDGVDLHSEVRHRGPVEPRRAAALLSQVAAALEVAHRAGLVHRDVKPANVLVTPADHVYLTDFGLARLALPESDGAGEPAGPVLGTVGYVAPEVLTGGAADARVDVYALGCLLFFVLTGRTPFEGPDRESVAAAHRTAPPPKVSEAAPAVPVALDAVIARALAKDPAERFASAPELADAARAALELVARELGMGKIEERAAALLAPQPGAGPREPAATPAPAERAALRREGDFWTIEYSGDPIRLRDAKGVRCLALLLANPGVEFHAVDLAAASAGNVGALAGGVGAGHPAGGGDEDLKVRSASSGDAGELLDAEAKRAYRRRLEDLRAELEEAESFNDPERAALAREEIEFLGRELSAAVGLGGRDRRAASTSERARVNVTRLVRTQVRKIGEYSEPLGAYLDSTVRTGTFCSYQPDPRAPIEWELVER